MADLEAPTPDPGAPPAPPSTPEPPAPPPPPPAAPEEPDDIPDGAIEQGGQVMVPLAALKAEREAVKTLKGKASQVEQIQAWYQQSKPYIDFLQANPDVMTRRQDAAPAAPEPQPQEDPELQELARTLDLYTTDGKPDAARAKKLVDMTRKSAREEAQTIVQPVQQQSLQERSVANYHQAAASVAPNGTKVDPNILWNVWSQGNPKDLATPQGAAAAWALALGLQSMQQPQTIQPPSQPPVITETPGSRFVNRAPISELDQRVINVRGMDPKKYAEYAKAFRPGEVNTIEE
jgi:hypothetical protein